MHQIEFLLERFVIGAVVIRYTITAIGQSSGTIQWDNPVGKTLQLVKQYPSSLAVSY